MEMRKLKSRERKARGTLHLGEEIVAQERKVVEESTFFAERWEKFECFLVASRSKGFVKMALKISPRFSFFWKNVKILNLGKKQ
jgi:hypothetical protein